MSTPSPHNSRIAIDFDRESELLPRELPSLAARLISMLIITLVASATVIAIVVPFPEQVDSTFVLVPKDGADPLKAPIRGTIEKVEISDGKEVKAGDVLFVIGSEDLAVLAARVKGLEREMESTTPLNAAQRESRKAAVRSAEVRVRSLEAELGYIVRQKEHAGKLRRMAEGAFAKNLIAEEALIREQNADDSAGRALEETRRQLAEARSTIAEAKAEQEREEAEMNASRTRLDSQLAEAQAALAFLERASKEKHLDGAKDSNVYRVLAPYDGTVIGMGPTRAGAVIERGEILLSLAAAGAELIAELSIPELESGRVAVGQSTRVMLDAYPYPRFGTRKAKVQWVSPTAEKGKLRALATIEDPTVVIDGVAKPLRAGMSGKARVRVGNRTLAEYALEPLRQLRENLGQH